MLFYSERSVLYPSLLPYSFTFFSSNFYCRIHYTTFHEKNQMTITLQIFLRFYRKRFFCYDRQNSRKESPLCIPSNLSKPFSLVLFSFFSSGSQPQQQTCFVCTVLNCLSLPALQKPAMTAAAAHTKASAGALNWKAISFPKTNSPA